MSSPSQELPDLFRFKDGTRVRTPSGWPARRKEIADTLIPVEYGCLPPPPRETVAMELHRCSPAAFPGARFNQYRVFLAEAPAVGFRLDVLIPPGCGPFPVILNGDACWRYVTDEITRDVLARGHALAQFSRVELAHDNGPGARRGGLYDHFPELDFGAISAWAWGYHRCVDVLQTLAPLDPKRIAVAGHSRGGKASLLAGATDERIALTVANGSGCCGAGCFRRAGAGSETLADILKGFPHWFAPGLKDYVDREETLLFDQHDLKALVAPRLLLTTEALGDHWANPAGTWQTHLAAREVYRFLDAGGKIGISFRSGGHSHTRADWQALLDFMDIHFLDKPAAASFDAGPFSDLPPAHTWRMPSCSGGL